MPLSYWALISAFVFATRIVKFLFFLTFMVQASSYLLCLYSSVSVGPVQKPHCWFFHEAAHISMAILPRREYVSNKRRREKTGLRGFRPGPTQTAPKKARILKFRFKYKRNCAIRAAKTKALISCTVTAQLISVLVCFLFFSQRQKSGFLKLFVVNEMCTKYWKPATGPCPV